MYINNFSSFVHVLIIQINFNNMDECATIPLTCAILPPAPRRSYLCFPRLLLNTQHFCKGEKHRAGSAMSASITATRLKGAEIRAQACFWLTGGRFWFWLGWQDENTTEGMGQTHTSERTPTQWKQWQSPSEANKGKGLNDRCDFSSTVMTHGETHTSQSVTLTPSGFLSWGKTQSHKQPLIINRQWEGKITSMLMCTVTRASLQTPSRSLVTHSGLKVSI